MKADPPRNQGIRRDVFPLTAFSLWPVDDDMARTCSLDDDPLEFSRRLALATRRDVAAVQQLIARSEATTATSRALLRKVERLEAAYFGWTREQGG